METPKSSKEIKIALVNELITLVNKGRNLKDISIKELTHGLNMSRTNFYNYFKDIYELIEWYYCNEIVEYTRSLYELDMTDEALKFAYNKILQNKNFHLNMFKNNPEFAIDKHFEKLVIQAIQKQIQKEFIAPEVLTVYFARTIVLTMSIWLESECSIDVEQMLEIDKLTYETTLSEIRFKVREV